jgi:hypothetical protein
MSIGLPMVSSVGVLRAKNPTNQRKARSAFDIGLPYCSALVDLPGTNVNYNRELGESLAVRTANSSLGVGPSTTGYRQSDVLRWGHNTWNSNGLQWQRYAVYYPSGIRRADAEGQV